MGINAKHRKNYKAGSVWKLDEMEQRAQAINKWWDKVKHLFKRGAK